MIITAIIIGIGALGMKDPKADSSSSVSLWNQFDDSFKKNASAFGLDWKILKAIAMNEAGLGVHPKGIEPSVRIGLESPQNIEGSKSSDGKSWGLMQMTVSTAKDYDSTATPEKLNNPDYTIKLSSQLLAWLFVQFKSSDPRQLEWVIKSYNQGRGNTSKEMRGVSPGYAGIYWERFQRNYNKLLGGM